MTSEHRPHRFSPEKMARLDSLQRRSIQPPGPLVEALGVGADTVVGDLGVGTGYFAIPIALVLKRLSGVGRVIGLDVAPAMLEELDARAVAAGVGDRIQGTRVSGDGDMPLPDHHLDRLISVNSVHELDDRPLVWRELARVLRPDGQAWLVDWRHRGPFDVGPPADHRVPSAIVAAELRGAGFRVDAVDLYSTLYTLRARRTPPG